MMCVTPEKEVLVFEVDGWRTTHEFKDTDDESIVRQYPPCGSVIEYTVGQWSSAVLHGTPIKCPCGNPEHDVLKGLESQ